MNESEIDIKSQNVKRKNEDESKDNSISVNIAEVEISDATIDDSERIAEIEKECFSLPWSKESVEESLCQDYTIFLKAVYKGNIVGYIGLYRLFEEGDITNVAVTASYRRNGIAKKLIETIIERSKTLGVHEITLEVRSSNKKAISLYNKIGFIEIGIRKDFYEKPIENANIMRYIVNHNN